MSVNSSLNSTVVKTEIDDVFVQAHNVETHPGYVNALSPSVFQQDSTDKAAEIIENLKGSGLWTQTSEEENLSQGDPRVTGRKTVNVVKFAQTLTIPAEFFHDNMHSTWEKMVRGFGYGARDTRDSNAFAAYRNAFTTQLSYDGTALISDSHSNLGGYTIDNKVTGALSESTLNDGIVQLIEQKTQDGRVGGNMPKVLLVPPKLFKTACEITESDLRSGTPDNDMNVYSTKYGIQVATSQWLGAAAGGSDTAWFLLSDNHSVMRFVREALTTWLIDPEYSENDTYKYGGKFREVVDTVSFEGLVGSNGS